MRSIEERKEIVKTTLAAATNAERSEFHKRVNICINATNSEYKYRTALKELRASHNKEVEDRNKAVSLIPAIFISVFAFVYFFGATDTFKLYFFIGVVALYAAMKFKELITDKAYLLEHRTIEIEIDRCTNEVKQFGVFNFNEQRLFPNQSSPSDYSFSTIQVRNDEAVTDLEEQILKSIFLLVEE